MAERYTAEQVDGEISYLELRATRLELDLQRGRDDVESIVTMSAVNHLNRAAAMLRQHAADLRKPRLTRQQLAYNLYAEAWPRSRDAPPWSTLSDRLQSYWLKRADALIAAGVEVGE